MKYDSLGCRRNVGDNVGDNEKQWMELFIGRFKNTLNYYGIADEYYAYRHIYYVELAKEWCQDHEIEFIRE